MQISSNLGPFFVKVWINEIFSGAFIVSAMWTSEHIVNMLKL